jgi:hypothetical protein
VLQRRKLPLKVAKSRNFSQTVDFPFETENPMGGRGDCTHLRCVCVMEGKNKMFNILGLCWRAQRETDTRRRSDEGLS